MSFYNVWKLKESKAIIVVGFLFITYYMIKSGQVKLIFKELYNETMMSSNFYI